MSMHYGNKKSLGMMACFGRHALLVLCVLFPLHPLLADGLQIDVVGSNAAYHHGVHDAIRQVFLDRGTSIRVEYHLLDAYEPAVQKLPVMQIALGRDAARVLSRSDSTLPLLFVLIDREEYLDLQLLEGRMASGLFLGQPLRRYLSLMRIALPEHDRLGAVLGPHSSLHLAELQQTAAENHLDLLTVRIDAAEQLPQGLKQVSREKGVLLALPDPVVVNADTARTLILTAYQQGLGLIAFSRALVKAGALMAVHSTPQQYGREAGELALAFIGGQAEEMPPPRYPSYFSVSVNYQLAQALGLRIQSEKELMSILREVERLP